MKARLSAFFIALALLISAWQLARGQSPADRLKATVVGLTGRWHHGSWDNKDTALAFAKDFWVGSGNDACILGDGGSVVLLIGSEAISYPCEQPRSDNGCAKTLGPKCFIRVERPKKQGLAASAGQFIAAAWARVSESPARYIVPVSRGLEGELAEAVVPLRGGQVDLTAALKDLPAGDYSLRLKSLDAVGKPVRPLPVNWVEGGTVVVATDGLEPGLYELTRGQPAGPPAWVLVSAPEDYARDTEAFRQAAEAVAKWPEDVDPRAPRMALRASLESLARRAGGPR